MNSCSCSIAIPRYLSANGNSGDSIDYFSRCEQIIVTLSTTLIGTIDAPAGFFPSHLIRRLPTRHYQNSRIIHLISNTIHKSTNTVYEAGLFPLFSSKIEKYISILISVFRFSFLKSFFILTLGSPSIRGNWRRGVTLRAPVSRETMSLAHGRTQGDAPTPIPSLPPCSEIFLYYGILLSVVPKQNY